MTDDLELVALAEQVRETFGDLVLRDAVLRALTFTPQSASMTAWMEALAIGSDCMKSVDGSVAIAALKTEFLRLLLTH